MTPNITIRTVKKHLASALPDVSFSYGTAGRGRRRGHCARWVGGPSEDEVRSIVHQVFSAWRCPLKHFMREMTETERAVWFANYELEQAAREAAEPARRAAAKAAGLAKRRETLAERKQKLTVLATAYPTVKFTFDKIRRVVWTDGPDVADVAKLLSLQVWNCDRTVTQAGKRLHLFGTRTARRLARSKSRAQQISAAIVRKAAVHQREQRRRDRASAQMSLF